MNLKNSFAEWFSPKAPKAYKTWFNKKLDGKLDDINDAYMASFGKQLFDIDIENISNEMSTIKNNVDHRHGAKNKEFAEYDKRAGNGIPKAIINQYYLRFLEIYPPDNPKPPLEVDKSVNYFSYEKDLQNALISQAEILFPGYKIFEEDGGGIEYNINGKRIDLLLEHKTEEKLLVIELKAGSADYKVFGQIAMYMGPLKQKYPKKEISGIIIAGEIDDSLKMAILLNENVKIKAYKMELTLEEIV